MLDEQRPIQSLSRDNLKKELWERAGISFNKSVFYFPRVSGGDMLAGKRFIQKRLLGTGDRMDRQLQWTSLKDGDLFLGVNGVSFFISSSSIASKDGDLAVFLDRDSFEVKVIVADGQYLELQNKIFFLKLADRIELLTVGDVAPNSWAEKFQVKKGDVLIGKAVLREAQNRRNWFLGLVKGKRKVLLEDREFALFDLDEAGRLFLEVFRDLGQFHNKNGDVMELVSYIRVPLIRDGNVYLREFYLHRFLGLGIDFGCGGGCDEAVPVISEVLPGSEVEKTGLRAGDGISGVNGKPVKTAGEVLALARKMGPGAEMEFSVTRGLENFRIRATIGWVVNK